MADLAKVKRNVAKMASMNAPMEDIDGYIASEGTSVDEVRNFKQQPGFLESTMTNLARPSAAIRERVRTLGNTGNIEQANQAANQAWENPASSETFQNEDLRNQNQFISKLPMFDKLPPSIQQNIMLQAGTPTSAIGVAKDFITDPVQMGAAALTEGILRGISPLKYKGLTMGERASELPVSKMMASKAGQTAKAAEEAYKAIPLTESLLKSQDPKFIKSIESGQVYNPAEQASKYISKSKNYTQLTDQMRMAEGLPMEERAKVYGSTKANPNRSHIDALDRLMMAETDPKINPQANSAASNTRLRNYQDIRTQEVNNLKGIPESELQNPEFWQKRKAYYQKEANEAGAYTGNEKMSARAKAYKALAEGAQEKTYALDESVRALNLENQGLGIAKERFAQLAAVERGATPKDIPSEIVEDIRPSKSGITAATLRTIGRKLFGNKVERLSGKVAKHVGKAEEAQSIANLIDDIIGKRNKSEVSTSLVPTEEQIYYAQDVPLKQLESPRDMANRNRQNDIKLGKLLSGASGSGKTIKMSGRGPAIEIPPYLESDLEKLASKYGIETYAPPRSSQSEFPKAPLSDKYTKPLRELIRRRNKNFKGRE